MALQLLNICKSYGVDVVLENVNMNIGDNEKVGLIGVNFLIELLINVIMAPSLLTVQKALKK